MSASTLDEALAIVRREMKRRGWSASGRIISRIFEGGNTVTFQVLKSNRSSKEASLVTINIGVYSARLGFGLGDDPAASRDVTRAHWRARIRDGDREAWLRVGATDEPPATAEALLQCLDGALHQVRGHITDEELRDGWLQGTSPGLTDLQRLVHVAILLAELGPADQLPGVLDELRGKVAGTIHEGVTAAHLSRVGIHL